MDEDDASLAKEALFKTPDVGKTGCVENGLPWKDLARGSPALEQ